MRALPEQLLNSLRALSGFNETAFIEAHKQEDRVTSVRLNPFKKANYSFSLSDQIPWSQSGYYLEQRPSFTLDPLFHAGAYYVQEPGSMFVEEAIRQTVNLNVPIKALDISAAPGGKSTLLNSLISPESLLVANEIIKSRAHILSYNLSKWGTANTVVTNNEPEKFVRLKSYFDLVVVDAPCSGSGLFRKQPEAIDEWSPAHVTACSVRQQKILEDILPCIKEGGILIYSTCSFSEEENENIIKNLVKTGEFELVPLKLDDSWGVVDSGFGCRFYPHLTRSEGFFLAVLRRVGEGDKTHLKSKNKVTEISNSEREIVRNFLPKINGSLFRINEQIHFANSAVIEFLMLAQDQFYFRKAGVVVGEIKGRDMVPNHDMALVINRSETLSTKELSHDEALRFLRKENLEPGEKVSGFCLMTHQNLGLGWAKILDKRVNNYLPNELRILK